MQITNIKDIIYAVKIRARGLFPGITQERIEEDILKSPLFAYTSRIVGYIQQDNVAIFFSAPTNPGERVRTNAYDVGDGVRKTLAGFEFVDGGGLHFRILPDAGYTILN